MKLYKIRYTVFVLIALPFLLSACTKKSYLTGEGELSIPKTSLTTYDYLKQQKYHLFDTLILIIDHFNLKSDVNEAATFFAPTDYSIDNYMDMKLAQLHRINENYTYTLDSLYNDITADSIRQYMFNKKITLTNATLTPVEMTSEGGTHCAFEKIKQTDATYIQWTSTPTYFLYYIKVNGALDLPGSTPNPNDPNTDVKVACQTTDIETASGGKTSSGAILNVLSNQHVFVRF